MAKSEADSNVLIQHFDLSEAKNGRAVPKNANLDIVAESAIAAEGGATATGIAAHLVYWYEWAILQLGRTDMTFSESFPRLPRPAEANEVPGQWHSVSLVNRSFWTTWYTVLLVDVSGKSASWRLVRWRNGLVGNVVQSVLSIVSICLIFVPMIFDWTGPVNSHPLAWPFLITGFSGWMIMAFLSPTIGHFSEKLLEQAKSRESVLKSCLQDALAKLDDELETLKKAGGPSGAERPSAGEERTDGPLTW